MEITLVPLEGLGRCLVAMTLQRPSVCLTPLIQATVRVRGSQATNDQDEMETGKCGHKREAVGK